MGLNSENFVAFNMTEGMQIIGGTWYGGEMKKGMFSMMNYLLPLKGMPSMHCSANVGEDGDVAIFFGLSGTGKTTLSTDPKRRLIGDDEHGWDDDGIFNFEGGCYAKVINLNAEDEPDIYRAIRRDACSRTSSSKRMAKSITPMLQNRKHPGVVPDLSYRQYRQTGLQGRSRQPGHFSHRRCLRCVTTGFEINAGTGGVLLPVRLHRQARRHRTRHHRTHTDIFRLLRQGVSVAAPDQIRRGAVQQDASVRQPGLPGQYRLGRQRQAYFHQGNTGDNRCNSRRLDRFSRQRDDSGFQPECTDSLPGVDASILDPRNSYADVSDGTLKQSNWQRCLSIISSNTPIPTAASGW